MAHLRINRIVLMILMFGWVLGGMACSRGVEKTHDEEKIAIITPEVTATSTTEPTPTVTPLPVVTGDLKGVTVYSICLDIQDNYVTGSEPFQQDLYGDLKTLMTMRGIRVAPKGGVCEATLKVKLTGRAVSAKYGGDRWCYTGSSAEGEVWLSMTDGRQINVQFREGVSTPWVITSCPEKASQAPIRTATSKGLLDAFSQIWSEDFLVLLIRSGNKLSNLYSNMAAEICVDHAFLKKEKALNCLIATATLENDQQFVALQKLQSLAEKARPAIPELISLFETGGKATSTPNAFSYGSKEKLQEELLKTLKTISGQDFGMDATKWRDWWESDQTFITSNGCKPGRAYIDAEGDVEKGYLDLLKVESNLEMGLLKVIFYLKELPESYNINNRGIGMNEGSVEYYWGVDIDVDHDDATGGDGSWGIPAKGVDYSMELFYYIHGNEKNGKMDRFLAKINKNEDNSIPQNTDISIDHEARTITLSGLIPGINENSELYFLAFQNLPNYKRFDDFLCQ